jgi:uncharacterized SAM-binding protein YcdF (DUF218 family)
VRGLTDTMWSAVRPDNALLILLGLGTGLLFTRRRRLGVGLVACAASALFAIGILPLGAWLLAPLENRFPPRKALPDRVHGVIVLGGSLDHDLTVARRQLVLRDPGERLVALLRLARRYPEARLVLAEGRGSLGPRELEEALPAKPFFADLGIDRGRVIVEYHARNTYENGLLTKRLVNYQTGQQWILITSAWHMPRAVGVFRKAGWPVIPYPVDYRTNGASIAYRGLDLKGGLERVSLAAREWDGLLAYRILGRSDDWLPAPHADAVRSGRPQPSGDGRQESRP